MGRWGASARDYYLVDPNLGDPAIHWYAHYLRSLAPGRVDLCALAPRRVLDRLGSLPTGRELPSLRQLAAGARDYVPISQLADDDGAGQPLTTPSGRSLATGAASPASRQADTTSSTSL